MFKKLFGSKDEPTRTLSKVSELMVGDIITMKHRSELPIDLQGQDLQITAVGTYQYASHTSTEFTLKTGEDKIYFLSENNDDGEVSLCFSNKLSRNVVLEVFDEEQFGLLWDDEEFPELEAQAVEGLESWLGSCYRQEVKYGQGFFYNRDCRKERLSSNRGSDDGEEFQFHECEGADDTYGLSIEVWEDGSTDVYLQVYTNTDVIEQFYPHGE